MKFEIRQKKNLVSGYPVQCPKNQCPKNFPVCMGMGGEEEEDEDEELQKKETSYARILGPFGPSDTRFAWIKS